MRFLTISAAFATLAACGGGMRTNETETRSNPPETGAPVGVLVPRADDELADPRNPRCRDALANVERVYGDDFEAALKRGIIATFKPLTRSQFYDSCSKWSIWMRMCTLLSRAAEEIYRCGDEPWIRESYAGLPEEEIDAYHACLAAARTRRDLDVCLERARIRTGK